MAYIYDLADTWNASGTTFNAIKMNVTDTASAAGSLLMDLQVGGVSRFSVAKTGTITVPGTFGYANAGILFASAGPRLYANGNLFAISNISYGMFGCEFGATQARLNGGVAFGFSSGDIATALDVILARDAANTLAQRNGVNAQAYNLYNTFTDASNYERFSMKWDANVFKFGNENAGTGSSFRNIEFYRGGVKMITLTGGEVSIDGGWLELKNAFTPWLIIPEDSSPPTFGYVNKAVIFAEDDGTGKTRLMVRFATGAAQQIAIEP